MSTTFLEKVARKVEEPIYILPNQMKRAESFGEYINRCIESEPGLNALKIEERAKAEANRRGSSYSISDATINKIVNTDQGSNLRLETLIALSWGLKRPLEEVAAKALGFQVADREFAESELGHLWETYKSLPPDEKKVFKRYIQMLAREMSLGG